MRARQQQCTARSQLKVGIGHVWILIILVVVALLMFGPARLPEIGRGLGEAFRDFKRELNEANKPQL
jgi:TatA/E family protein of Tat protein translocase